MLIIPHQNFILKDNYVGFASISLSQIMDAVVQPNTRFVLIDTQRQGKEPGYTNSGLLAFDAIAIQ